MCDRGLLINLLDALVLLRLLTLYLYILNGGVLGALGRQESILFVFSRLILFAGALLLLLLGLDQSLVGLHDRCALRRGPSDLVQIQCKLLDHVVNLMVYCRCSSRWVLQPPLEERVGLAQPLDQDLLVGRY